MPNSKISTAITVYALVETATNLTIEIYRTREAAEYEVYLRTMHAPNTSTQWAIVKHDVKTYEFIQH